MANRKRPLRLGVIGCGWVAQERHLPALHDLRDAEVIAISDTNAECLNRVAERFHIQNRCLDYRVMLDLPTIEAVAVCVPTQFHVEIALAVLDAGKHVFIEKPLALNLDDAARLIERAAQSRHKAMVGFNMRWHRLVRQAREIIQRGSLGGLDLMRTVFTAGSHFRPDLPPWRLQHELGGGLLFEHAVHHFDLWRFLLRSEVEEVLAKSWGEQSAAERTTVAAQMENGVLAASVFSLGASADNELEIYGQAGRLRVSCYRFDGLDFCRTSDSPGGIRTRVQGVARALREVPQAVLRLRQGGDYVASYQAEWRHFIDAVRHDTPVECTLTDGRRALQVALAAMHSAASGQAVKVAQAPAKITPLPSQPSSASRSAHGSPLR